MNKVHYSTFVKGKTYYIHAHYKEENKKYIGEFSHNQDVYYSGGRYYFTFTNVSSITEKFSGLYHFVQRTHIMMLKKLERTHKGQYKLWSIAL
jgi:hypothetical protein